MSLFWFELSKADRDRTDAWLRALRNEETVDSLGLADLLEKLSDRLYPATVTGMTRARYLLFVPLIYKHVARFPERDPLGQAKRMQARLAAAVGNEPGNIGVRRGEGLSRFPSSRYWKALLQLGILRRDVSETEYLAAIFDTASRELLDDDGVAHRTAAPDSWWAPEAQCEPIFAAGRFRNATLELPRDERNYLRKRYLDHARGSLLAHCIEGRLRLDAEGPWTTEVPNGHLRTCTMHARAFRAILRIANLLYAFLVTETRVGRLGIKGRARQNVDTDDGAALDATELSIERCLRAHRRRLTAWSPAQLMEMLELGGHRAHAQVTFLEDIRGTVGTASGALDLVRRTREKIESREQQVRPSKRRLGPEPRLDLLRQWDAHQHADLYERSARHGVARQLVNDLVGARSR